jgi:hypothetical protein
VPQRNPVGKVTSMMRLPPYLSVFSIVPHPACSGAAASPKARISHDPPARSDTSIYKVGDT